MPLPWLIGAAVVAVGAAAVAALSDDDKSSNNNDDEERRRRAAERERQERARNEKKLSIKHEFEQGVEQTYQDFITSIPDLVIIHGAMVNHLTLSSNGSNWAEMEFNLEKTAKFPFEKDIALFEQIYGVEVEQTENMKRVIKEVDLLQGELDQLTLAIKKLS